MSTDKGYIKVYRDIRDHWIWQDAELLKAWIDIVMMAYHKDDKVFFKKEWINVKRGDFPTTVRHLASRWGWGKDRVLKFLRMLEKDGMIDRKTDSKKTLITVINYGVYQSAEKKKQTRSGTQSGTQTGTQSGTQTSHDEYIKEYIKESIKKKKAPPPDDDDFIPDLRKACEEDDDDDW